MNVFEKCVAILLLCMVPLLSFAGGIDDETSALITAVESKYAGVTVLQADFTQTTRSALFGEEIQRGDVTLKRPSMMFWNFTNEKQFVTDGATMWIYTRADNQVIRYEDISSGTSAVDMMLQSLDKISELFNVVVLESSDEGHAMELTPREENQQFKKVILRLSNDLVVTSVVINDAFDNRTELSFDNVRLDGQVPDSTFRFTIPDGAEVITAGM